MTSIYWLSRIPEPPLEPRHEAPVGQCAICSDDVYAGDPQCSCCGCCVCDMCATRCGPCRRSVCADCAVAEDGDVVCRRCG